MAGESGFKTAINGFDKKEVNDYISKINKNLKELEAEKHSTEAKIAAALKTAEEAEGRIKAAEKQAADKIAELEIQAKTERRNAESLTIQIDELKRKLKHQPSAAGGKVDVSAAQKQSAEIIERANKTAQEIVDKAKRSAQDIMARAQSASAASGGTAGKNVDAFMNVLKECLNNITNNCGELGKKASELLAAGSAPVSVEMPDFSDISAPKAAVPPSYSEPTVSSEPEMSLSGNLFENMDESSDDMSFDFGKEDDVAPINPKTPKAEVIEGFDLSNVGVEADMPVDNVAPIDTNNLGRAEPDSDFAKDLIVQTVPSSALGSDVGEDLIAAVKMEEEKFAVKASDEKGMDFSMDMDDKGADDSANADDPMAALLAQAQAAFGGVGGGIDLSEPEPEPESAPSMGMGSSGDWADLQKQLEAMEKSGSFGGEPEPETPAAEPPKEIADDPKAPSADDSAIWNFGDMSSGSSDDDDDMSSDLFGSF